MNRPANSRDHFAVAAARRAFTILELLLALALVGMVLVALNSFVFSMGELWGRNADLRLFEQHTRAVTRFLEQELRLAALPPAVRTGIPAIAPQEVRTSSGVTENLLTYELLATTRLISWPDRPLPEVVCSLQVRAREGMWLLWRSRLEKHFDDDPPHEALISPLVSAISYDYYDENFKNWKNEPTLRRDAKNQLESPRRIRLKFTYGKLGRETVITLPVAAEGLPAS